VTGCVRRGGGGTSVQLGSCLRNDQRADRNRMRGSLSWNGGQVVGGEGRGDSKLGDGRGRLLSQRTHTQTQLDGLAGAVVFDFPSDKKNHTPIPPWAHLVQELGRGAHKCRRHPPQRVLARRPPTGTRRGLRGNKSHSDARKKGSGVPVEFRGG